MAANQIYTVKAQVPKISNKPDMKHGRAPMRQNRLHSALNDAKQLTANNNYLYEENAVTHVKVAYEDHIPEAKCSFEKTTDMDVRLSIPQTRAKTLQNVTGEMNQLKDVYERLTERNRSAGVKFSDNAIPLAADQLSLAFSAMQSVIAGINDVVMDSAMNLQLLQSLNNELPFSFANPNDRLEKNIRCCYKIGQVIGKGAFGRVHIAKHRLIGTKVAVKSYFREYGAKNCCIPSSSVSAATKTTKPQIRKMEEEDALDWKRVRQEVKVMGSLQPHPSIIRFIEAFETATEMHVVMEYVDGRDMCDYLKRESSQKLSELRAKRMFKQLCAAVASLHAQNIIHRDLKLENIIVDAQDRPRIIDFGFSQYEREIVTESNATISKSCLKNTTKNFCGTPSYMAPEVIACKSYNGKLVDVWSLGVILYVLLCGKFPFQGGNLHQLYQNIRNSSLFLPVGLSKDVQGLLQQMLVVNPAKRLHLSDILRHQWLNPPSPPNTLRQQIDSQPILSFIRWDGAMLIVCSALEQLYGFDQAKLIEAMRQKRRNAVTAFIKLTILPAEKQFELLLRRQATDQANMTAAVENYGEDEVRIGAYVPATHKQQLEQLIGLVKSSLF